MDALGLPDEFPFGLVSRGRNKPGWLPNVRRKQASLEARKVWFFNEPMLCVVPFPWKTMLCVVVGFEQHSSEFSLGDLIFRVDAWGNHLRGICSCPVSKIDSGGQLCGCLGKKQVAIHCGAVVIFGKPFRHTCIEHGGLSEYILKKKEKKNHTPIYRVALPD